MTDDESSYNYVIKIEETISSFFSSLAISIASFAIIATLLTAIDSDGRVVVQGNEVKWSWGFLGITISLAVLLLCVSCFVLYILREVSND
jgi:hypothetical protein